MPKSISGTNILYSDSDVTQDGLIFRATVTSGTPPTTASIWAPGASVTDLSTGTRYRNTGTSASPSWDSADAVTNSEMSVPKIVVYQETIAVGSFTDGGATAGTLSLATSIPAGSVFLNSAIHGLTGFAGDTSAVMTIGDGSDVDRYNTGTPNVFTTAAAGVSVGAASGTAFHSAAITPVVTVTTAADFTACKSNGSGAVTITLVYIRPV